MPSPNVPFRQGLLLCGLLAAAVLLTACPPSASDSVYDDPARSITLKVPDDPTVSFNLWVRVGSQNDPAGKEGLAALTGALIAGGATTENSYEDILKKLYPLASTYDVSVDKEMTAVTGRVHKDNLDAYFELLTDAYLRPAFNEDDFNRTKNDQLNYLTTQLRYASDEELGKAALMDFIYDGTAYRHPIAGTVAGLESITIDDVKAFYQKYYNRANVVTAIGGGFDVDLLERFEATIDQLPEGEAASPVTVTPAAIEGNQVMLVEKDGADASISFGYPISVQRGERDFYALWIANSWLGEHRNQSSHLYQVIRETRGMNYGDYSYIEAFPQGGFRQMPPTNVARNHQIFQIWIRTLPNAQAHFAIRAATRELQDLIENGMSEEEFELTRSFLSKYYLHFAGNNQGRLGYAVDDSFYGIEEGHLNLFGEMMASITREEVNAALKEHLRFDNMKIAVITGDAENMAEALKNDTPSPIEYPTPKSEEVLAEDKEISTYSIPIADVKIVPVEEIFGK